MRKVPVFAVFLAALSCAPAATPAASPMQSFASDASLKAFFKARYRAPSVLHDLAPASAAVEEAPEASIVVTGALAQSITNTQEADVDEGGIVKVHGNHLVILRRGRLFTVALGDRSMRAVSAINAFPPGTDGENAWYDEMLVSGDRVLVIGFTYGRGGTEINRFRIDAAGNLRAEDSYHLRSDDYYSASNYASRLIGDKLIFYTPLRLGGRDIIDGLPALRRWNGKEDAPFRRITPAARVFLPEPLRRDKDSDVSTLHTVTVCTVSKPVMDCTATGVLGSSSRSFYVSGKAVYVWISDAISGRKGVADRALVYRLPLDGGQPGAVQAWGGPVDQFSFREDRAAASLDVVVRADTGGDRMWRPVVSYGDAALARLALSQFGDGRTVAGAGQYRSLPLPSDDKWGFHNRFVGSHLVYAAGEWGGETNAQTVFVAPVAGGAVTRITAPHAVDRIDITGTDAMVIGNDEAGRLGFTSILLPGAALGDSYFLAAAREGESRSQAFFFRPDPDSPDGASGIVGLPVMRELAESAVNRFLGSGSAVAFLRRNDRQLRAAGELVAQPASARDDGCVASCVDWYGNARPIFLNGRIFALMGYELVEGRLEDGRIREIARLDFAPRK